MESILVIGAGFMGSGIAQVCAQSSYRVHLMDINPAALEKALGSIKWSVDKLSSKGLLKESPDTVLGRITAEQTLASAAGVQWVIEAALEVEELKKRLLPLYRGGETGTVE